MAQDNVPWISPEGAINAAATGLAEYRLNTDPTVGSILMNGRAGRPLLVERLDKPRSAYFLIPWMIQRKVALLVEVDALSGELLSASALAEPTSELIMSEDDALEAANRAFPEYTFGSPRLVWRPCQESTTSTRPFFQIPYQRGVVYVSMDGSVLRELSDLGLGG